MDGSLVFTQTGWRGSLREGLFEPVKLLCAFALKRVLSTREAGQEQLEQWQKMDCAKLKRTGNFSSNYNSVQLAIT